MHLKEYQRLARRSMNDGLSVNGQILMCLVGLLGELGEVSEPLKKHIFRGQQYSLDSITLELGDVLWYLTMLADTLGIDMSDVAEYNVTKLAIRHGLDDEE